MKWLVDPKNDKQSVTLTLLVVSFTVLILLAIGESFGYVKSTGPLLEIFITIVTLYFGRRTKLKTKNIDIDQEGLG